MNVRQLGARIKSQREKRRLRQADIAGALQISAQAVSKWERGENAPDIATLAPLARLLGVSIEWLLGANAPNTDTFEATVFCTSLNGYAERATRMPPRDVANWINGVYYTVTEAVRRCDGVPVKYVGDGFLGFFAGTTHTQRALKAARNLKSLADNPDIIVVLHVGEIFLDTIGHPDYARPDIIGEAVNLAFLVMPWVAANCPTGVGVTEAVVHALEDEGAFERSGEAPILGEADPVAVYEPLAG